MNKLAPKTRPAAPSTSRVLILGGTREARDLGVRVARAPAIEAILSLAGRTSAPLETELPTRVGGFGGVEGLMRFLSENAIDRVLDATHPFAVQISANARAACAALGLPLAVLSRPPWRPVEDDRWIEVANNEAAAAALGLAPRRVFLTIGRLGVSAFRAASQHWHLIRSIEAPAQGDLPPQSKVILARGPFTLEDEAALMQEHRIDILVSKNSGGPLTYAKIEAARALGLPVVMVSLPSCAGVEHLQSLEEAMAFLGGSAIA
jgi:precorrin-6A/cobalt-precorrin-6A reductase